MSCGGGKAAAVDGLHEEMEVVEVEKRHRQLPDMWTLRCIYSLYRWVVHVFTFIASIRVQF
jgi:hypothetical protein